MLGLEIVNVKGLPSAVTGTVPSGATHATTSERIRFAGVVINVLARVVEFSRYAVITVPSGRPSAG